MAETGTDDRQRLMEEIARKEEMIQKLRTAIASNEERIKKLEDDKEAQKEEIKALKAKNKEREDKIKALEEEIDKMKNENESKVKKLEARIDKLEKDSNIQTSVLVIIQIVTAIQRNICKYVLGKHFKESNFYKVKYMDTYFGKIIVPAEREIAKVRWSELEDDNNIWDESLIESFKNLNQTRIGIAHPKLTSEKIQDAMDCLEKEDPDLMNDDMVDNVRKLKKCWETSESLLRKPDPQSANKKPLRGLGVKRKQPETAYLNKRQRRLPGAAGKPRPNGVMQNA